MIYPLIWSDYSVIVLSFSFLFASELFLFPPCGCVLTSTMSSQYRLILLALYLTSHSSTSSTQQNITFNAISTLNAFSGKSIVGAQWIAIQEINNSTDLLPNYNLSLDGLFIYAQQINHSHTVSSTYSLRRRW